MQDFVSFEEGRGGSGELKVTRGKIGNRSLKTEENRG
jgi:hypothetical protein